LSPPAHRLSTGRFFDGWLVPRVGDGTSLWSGMVIERLVTLVAEQLQLDDEIARAA
jgi:hypothetical protein